MKAFPEHERQAAVIQEKLGIDIEASFRTFLANITGKDEEGVEELIERSASSPELPLPVPTIVSLADRQGEVLSLKGAGLSNPEIAERLDVSIESVKTHVAHAIQRLGAKNATHAVAIAISTGMLKPTMELKRDVRLAA